MDEPLDVTRAAEIKESSKGRFKDISFFEGTYRLRLTKRPTANVTIHIRSEPVATDTEAQLLASRIPRNNEFDERIQKRGQLELSSGVEFLSLISLNFTVDDWFDWKEVRVSAIDDSVTEGVDLLNFPSQPSFLSFIQGPLEIFGLGRSDVPGIQDPLTLPEEKDDSVFNSPENVNIDTSSLRAKEENQVDRLIIKNLDVRGSLPSVGDLTVDQLTGFNMGQNIRISGTDQRDGIVYSGMEVIEIRLGDGVDRLDIENTTECLHILNLGPGDDTVHVKNISGPFVIYGNAGNDAVNVTSDATRLDQITALLVFDGGESGENDVGNYLLLDDRGEAQVNDVVNVTRLLVETERMIAAEKNNTRAPLDSYFISLCGATGGYLSLVLVT